MNALAHALFAAVVKCLLGLTMACAACCAAADPFKVVTSDYPPYSFTEGHTQKGMAIDVLKEAFARMKVELSIEFMPFPRAIQLFRTAEADGIFPFAVKEDRLAFTLYPKEPLIADTQSLFVRADSHIAFNGRLAPLGDYVFGKQRDAFNGQAFDDAVSAGQIRRIEETKDQRQVVLMLVASRFDIAVGPSLVVKYFAKQTGNATAIKELRPSLGSPLQAYLGLSKQKDFAALSERLDRTIAGMRQDGSYQRIISQYLN